MASYAAAAKAQSEIYSSLKVLWQFLSSPRWNTKSNRSRIRLLEYFENADEVHRSSEVPNLQDVLAGIRVELRNTQNGRQGCVIVVEDIEPSQVEMLGEALDIDPVFFAGYLGTDFRNLEHHALPLWATTLPSESASQESLHLHHQRPTRLTTNAVIPKHVILVTNGNVVRAVRRLSTIGDTNVALVRSCCSLIRKVFESGFWICMFKRSHCAIHIADDDEFQA
ncbi:uncharacterized protein KY384_004043 [Bacidia gigantensis]|uniref:uncharacterized protein n=1 Tax=Bacidia gigantensis TaxID=2732470 RepID=UPI001D03A51C|nr:uncharacterized protein KY384_004043 [Bacidia gigantensis]KAG8530688.1 hypothetical protein KY384_004043 [Bacidia gigantensis]